MAAINRVNYEAAAVGEVNLPGQVEEEGVVLPPPVHEMVLGESESEEEEEEIEVPYLPDPAERRMLARIRRGLRWFAMERKCGGTWIWAFMEFLYGHLHQFYIDHIQGCGQRIVTIPVNAAGQLTNGEAIRPYQPRINPFDANVDQ